MHHSYLVCSCTTSHALLSNAHDDVCVPHESVCLHSADLRHQASCWVHFCILLCTCFGVARVAYITRQQGAASVALSAQLQLAILQLVQLAPM